MELKPCPFCGSQDIGLWTSYGYEYLNYVWCGGCGAKTESFPEEAQAIEAWNRRADNGEREAAD